MINILVVTILLAFIQPSLATTPISGTTLIPTLTEERIKEVEGYLAKTVPIGLPPEGYSLREKALFLHLQLSLHKKRALNLLKGYEAYKGKDIGRDEEGLAGLSHLAVLYIDAYKAGAPEFKEKVFLVLRDIQKAYYDERLGVFSVRVEDRDVVTLPAAASATIAFLKAGEGFKDKEIKAIARRALAYLEKNLIGKEGTFHVHRPDTGEVLMDGQLIDNAWAGLLMLEGYKAFLEPGYLDTAKGIANFSIDRLYDPRFGGFIQRNSNSLALYPPGEDLYIGERPFEENGLMMAFYISLYEVTGERRYLDVFRGGLGYLSGYYREMTPGGQLYLFTGLLQYPEITRKGPGEWEERLPPVGILPLIALSFFAGLLSFLSPCTLPILPAYFAFTFQGDRKRIVAMTIAFFLGLAMVFSLMGGTTSFIGSFLRANMRFLTTLGGIAIICFGIMSILGKGFSGARIFQRNPSTTLGGSFIFGATMALGWTACVGPILAGVLVLAATEEGVWRGVGLLFVYALGLGLPLIFLSLIFKGLDKDGIFWRFLKGKGWEVKAFGREFLLHSTSIISGLLFVLLGGLMATGYLAYMNRVIPLKAQVWFADAEEWLTGLFR